MKNILIIIFVIGFCSESHSQWVLQNMPIASGNVLSVDFADSQHGIACGVFLDFTINARASYTTNAGAFWMDSALPDSARVCHDVKYINPGLAYMCGEFTPSPENTSLKGAFFMSSRDNGIHWNSVNSVLPDDYYLMETMDFINSSTGVSVVSKFKPPTEEILFTSDSGRVWNRIYVQDDSLVIDISEIEYVNLNIIFASGVNVDKSVYNGVLIKTTNGGASWDHTIFTNFVINGISFSDDNTGMMCGVSGINSYSEIYRTTDRGNTWINVFTFPDDFYSGVKYFPESQKVLLFGYNVLKGEGPAIQISNNNGNTWTSQTLPVTPEVRLNSAAIPDQNYVYVAGGELFSSGSVLHSSNGGKTFIENIELSQDFKLLQNYPNPFNPVTKIGFQMNRDALVDLSIFDIRGKKISTIVNGKLNSGDPEYYFDGNELPAGAYFYRLKSDSYTLTKKMLLIK